MDKLFIEKKREVDSIGWEGSYSPKCTVTEVNFKAEVYLKYSPSLKLIEFIEFEKRLAEILNNKIMVIEDVPAIIIYDVLKGLDPKSIEVEVFASTTVHNDASAKLVKDSTK